MLFYPFFFFLCVAFQLLEGVELLRPKVLAQIPHDCQAFTQGLAVEKEKIYESTGLYGASTLRCLDLLTKQMKIEKTLPRHVFAEGIAVFPDRIIQLSWKEECAFVYDRPAFTQIASLPYKGEGWGLCRDQETVWMSNGSAFLVQRDSHTFAIMKTVHVSLEGIPVSGLNDLESVDDALYANVWLTDCILRINKQTGEVTGLIDASQLLSHQEKKRLNPHAVLNGIAFQSETKKFFLTGKEWPWIFQVEFLSVSKRLEQPWKYLIRYKSKSCI